MCPVNEIFSSPEAKSQNLTVLSAEPVAKKPLQGDTAIHLTHPWCPTITLYSLKGGCQFGLISFRSEEDRIVPSLVDYTRFISRLLFFDTTKLVPFYLASSVCSPTMFWYF